jgi:hypothetical protein
MGTPSKLLLNIGPFKNAIKSSTAIPPPTTHRIAFMSLTLMFKRSER